MPVMTPLPPKTKRVNAGRGCPSSIPANTARYEGSTFARNTDDQIPAQFPGQSPASTLRDNSKGFAAQYTAVLSPSVINVLNFGYTRFGQSFTGQTGPLLFQTSLDPLLNPYARPSAQVLPTTTINEGITWVKSKHTITFGGSSSIIHNNTSSYAMNFSYIAKQQR